MKVIGGIGRGIAHVLVVIAKAIGAMRGATTAGQDNAASIYRKRDEYRP